MEAGQHDLASELLRFLIPPGDNDILAAMPSHSPAGQQDDGKPAHSEGTQSAGVRASGEPCHVILPADRRLAPLLHS